MTDDDGVTEVHRLGDASDEEVALVDLVNRILDRGVVVRGDVLISVAGVDLIELGLSLYVASAEVAEAPRGTIRRSLPPKPGEEPDGADS